MCVSVCDVERGTNGGRSSALPFPQSQKKHVNDRPYPYHRLYKATGDKAYLKKAESMYDACCKDTAATEFSWDRKSEWVRDA